LVDPRPGVKMDDKNQFLRGRISKYRQAAKQALYEKYEKFYKEKILPNKIRRPIRFGVDEGPVNDFIEKLKH